MLQKPPAFGVTDFHSVAASCSRLSSKYGYGLLIASADPVLAHSHTGEAILLDANRFRQLDCLHLTAETD
jgi:hypothetical protein